MLKFMKGASAILVGAAGRVTAPLRTAIELRKERASLARLMDADDHLLNDIGLTQGDIAAMLRQDRAGFTPTSWASDPRRAAFALQ
jgi:uncharacterized protein YjiS (DUF1127 family)